MLDAQLFGLRPAGFHAVNLVLHVLVVCSLYRVLSLTTGNQLRSAWVAVIFGIHPVHVESVAWISERKDVLSGLFWMLALLAYVRYVQADSRREAFRNYIAVTLMFGLGLLSKPMVVTFPFVLPLLDFWPLRRWHIGQHGKSIPPVAMLRQRLFYSFLEKLPWCALSAIMCAVTIKSQGAAVVSLNELSQKDRLLHTPVAYMVYLSKTVWPVDLAVFYPREVSRDSVFASALSVCLLTCITAVCWSSRKYAPARIVGWLWFLGTLVPVIGIVQAGNQAFADRYLYLPQVGLLILLCFGISPIRNATCAPEPGKSHCFLRTHWWQAGGMVILPLFVVLSHIQVGYWRDSFRLYEHALSVTRDNWQCHFNLGAVLSEAGRHAEAIPHYQSVLRLRPLHPKIHKNLGVSLVASGNLSEAIRVYRDGLALHPENTGLRMNLGNALARAGEFDTALAEYRKAELQDPHNLQLLFNLSQCMAISGNKSEAIKTARRALELPVDSKQRQFHQQIQRQVAEWEQPDLEATDPSVQHRH
jgi:protein O-mannosyl-transferase